MTTYSRFVSSSVKRTGVLSASCRKRRSSSEILLIFAPWRLCQKREPLQHLTEYYHIVARGVIVAQDGFLVVFLFQIKLPRLVVMRQRRRLDEQYAPLVRAD